MYLDNCHNKDNMSGKSVLLDFNNNKVSTFLDFSTQVIQSGVWESPRPGYTNLIMGLTPLGFFIITRTGVLTSHKALQRFCASSLAGVKTLGVRYLYLVVKSGEWHSAHCNQD